MKTFCSLDPLFTKMNRISVSQSQVLTKILQCYKNPQLLH